MKYNKQVSNTEACQWSFRGLIINNVDFFTGAGFYGKGEEIRPPPKKISELATSLVPTVKVVSTWKYGFTVVSNFLFDAPPVLQVARNWVRNSKNSSNGTSHREDLLLRKINCEAIMHKRSVIWNGYEVFKHRTLTVRVGHMKLEKNVCFFSASIRKAH